ncbi:O-antigen/teichoic acid export membrane protein [Solirubrobacter pauli]|uniref:O-antigen/teichoic acid export membrane protein n=1 Tax=Solirubrobacter pauli TaxID=166793 RepID=A0A660L9Q7_9ACTN|nr:O-antigen/teichoic acid export membrane protein [Solirubrobacter pauli]
MASSVTGARTIARNALAVSAAQVLGKLASLGFYVVMARVLGEQGFGAYTFALSLAQLTTVFAGFGIDEWMARTIARDPKTAPRLMTDALVAKSAFGVAGCVAAVVFAVVAGYSGEVQLTVAFLALGALVELYMNIFNATFQGLDDLRWPAAATMLERASIGIIGIVALLAGAGIVVVAAIYLACALAATALVMVRLAAIGVRPAPSPSAARALGLVKMTFTIGLTVLLNTALFRVDTVLLSLIKDDAAVGFYGAAYRLLESPLFVAYGMTAALLPALSRASRTSAPPLRDLVETGLKLILCALAPIGTAFAVLAEPIVDVVYGPDYADAVAAVRLLGGAAALYGVGYFGAFVLIAQGRQRILPQITAGVLVLNVVLNLVLIPAWSFRGAALVTSLSELLLAIAFMGYAMRVAGRLSARRVLSGPLAGCVAIALVALALGPTVPALVVAPIAYVVVLLAVERWLYPQDLRTLVAMVRRG